MKGLNCSPLGCFLSFVALIVLVILVVLIAKRNAYLDSWREEYRERLLAVHGVERLDGPSFYEGYSWAILYLSDGGRLDLMSIDDALFEDSDMKLVGIGDYSVNCRGGAYSDEVLMLYTNQVIPSPRISNVYDLVSRYDEVLEVTIRDIPLSPDSDETHIVSIVRDSTTYIYECSRYLKK